MNLSTVLYGNTVNADFVILTVNAFVLLLCAGSYSECDDQGTNQDGEGDGSEGRSHERDFEQHPPYQDVCLGR
jgi:hypothetical protein